MNRNLRIRHGGSSSAGGTTLTAIVAGTLMALLLPVTGAAGPQAAPTNQARPQISGIAAKGQTLTASSGSWAGSTPMTFAYQWRRCDADDADDCDNVSGAVGQTYALDSDDVGKRVRVNVTASNADGSSQALSDATAKVTEGTPISQADPRISGTASQGQQLTATNGTWVGVQPMTFTYQWVRCGADGGDPLGSRCAVISGATKSTYTPVAADVGSRLRIRVTAKNSAGGTTDASNATAVVNAAKAPANTRRPAITGSMVEGATVTLDRGAWTGASSFSFQWLRCNTAGGECVPIPGATGTQYKLTRADVGHRIRANVTARNSRGPTTVMSGEPATVVPAGPAGVVLLPTGERSIPATSVATTERLVVSEVRFSPNPIRSRTAPINVRVRVKDTRGFAVRDALVFVRSTPLVTRGQPSRVRTATDGWASFTMIPRFSFPRPRNGFNVQYFVKAYRAGDDPLAGVAGYRLVQVRLAR